MVVVYKDRIEILAYFSDQKSKVVIAYNPWGGQWWNVHIDHYSYGRVWSSRYGWQHDVKLNGLLSLEDLDTIIDLIKYNHRGLISHSRCRNEYRWDFNIY